jgi:uncharacterized protein YjeT (DUF2065 family)
MHCPPKVVPGCPLVTTQTEMPAVHGQGSEPCPDRARRLCYHPGAMSMNTLRNLGFVLAFVILGAVLFSLYGAFRTAIEGGNWIAFLGGILLGSAFVAVLLIIGLVPDKRPTGWVKAITNVNAKYLFFFLVIGWIIAMAILASLNLPANTIGAPALVIGLFGGFFVFMGFIWAVIGE